MVVSFVRSPEFCRQEQLRQRHGEVQHARKQKALPPPDLIIAVLIELIQRIELEPKQLACRLSRKGIKLSIPQIQSIFLQYDLDNKKKRP